MEKYGMFIAIFPNFDKLEEQLEQLHIEDFDLMFPQFIPQNLIDPRSS